MSAILVERDVTRALGAGGSFCVWPRVASRWRVGWASMAAAPYQPRISEPEMETLNSILHGVLVGGLYALFAAGLSLIFGVMRLVNLIVLAACVAMEVAKLTGLHPLLALVFVVLLMAAFGYAMQRWIFNRTLGGGLFAAAAGQLWPVRDLAERAAVRVHRR